MADIEELAATYKNRLLKIKQLEDNGKAEFILERPKDLDNMFVKIQKDLFKLKFNLDGSIVVNSLSYSEAKDIADKELLEHKYNELESLIGELTAKTDSKKEYTLTEENVKFNKHMSEHIQHRKELAERLKNINKKTGNEQSHKAAEVYTRNNTEDPHEVQRKSQIRAEIKQNKELRARNLTREKPIIEGFDITEADIQSKAKHLTTRKNVLAKQAEESYINHKLLVKKELVKITQNKEKHKEKLAAAKKHAEEKLAEKNSKKNNNL